MIRQVNHFKVCLWFKQFDGEGLWAEEKLSDVEDIYYDPFDLEIKDTFDDASKIINETYDPEPESEPAAKVEN